MGKLFRSHDEPRPLGKEVRLEGFTYQMDSPVGLDLELAKLPLKHPLKIPLEWSLTIAALGYL